MTVLPSSIVTSNMTLSPVSTVSRMDTSVLRGACSGTMRMPRLVMGTSTRREVVSTSKLTRFETFADTEYLQEGGEQEGKTKENVPPLLKNMDKRTRCPLSRRKTRGRDVHDQDKRTRYLGEGQEDEVSRRTIKGRSAIEKDKMMRRPGKRLKNEVTRRRER